MPDTMKVWTWAVALGWILLAVPGAFAQAGKLAGRVTDASTGEPLPGATVLLVGTTLGTATDANGDYAVLNIPPGTYNVRYSIIGFQTQIVEGVLISSNQTTEQDVALGEEVIQGEEVVVTADRPVVDVGLTSSMQTLSREDISVLPVQQLDDIVNLQAGVVDGHFRGGRLGEVQYQVDGVSVNNPYDNVSTLQLDRSVLQEVQVIQGTFDAKYGQAMSGVVNAVLRSGDPNRYEFSVEAYMGDYVSPGNDSTVVRYNQFGQQFADTVVVFPYIDDIRPTVRQNYQASLSGPVPLVPNTTFLVNGQRFVNEGHLMGRRDFVPTDRITLPTDTSEVEFNPSGDGALVPMDFERQWALLGKLSNRSVRRLQVDYQAIANWIERQGYNHAYRFNPDGVKTAEQFSIVHGLDVTHTLTDRFYYKASLRQNYFDYKDLKFEDIGTAPPDAGTLYLLPGDSPYVVNGRPISDRNYDTGADAVVQGVDLGRFVQRTNTLLGKLEVTSQATKVHLLEGGLEVQVSDLEFGTPGRVVALGDPLQLYVQRDTAGARVDVYDPVFGSAYVQDRIEWGDLRVRAGLRLEYFDANATVPRDLQNPAGTIAGAPALPDTTKPTTKKLVLAPRLGISFPILAQASMFFSYGHFYQMPPLRDMFANADYSVLRDLQAGAVDYGVLGNPDLKPEFTTQYEFGFKSAITESFGLDLSLFYKDIRDLLGVEFIQTYTAAEYARLTNVDFGGVRGFTLALDHRALGPLSVSLDYTLQVAVGNSSDPKETANRAEAGEDPRPRQVPFNWDQRHTLNGTAIWYQPGNFALTGIVKFSSGQPYTPTISTGFDAELEDNSGRKPNAVIVDLRAEKFFRLGGIDLTAFARVFNLLDTHFNNGDVYADTGSPYYTLIPEQQRNPNPNRLYPPRRVELGLSVRGVFSRE